MTDQCFPLLISKDNVDMRWKLSKEVTINVSNNIITEIYYENSDMTVSVTSCCGYSISSEQGHVELGEKLIDLVKQFAQSHGYQTVWQRN